MPNARIAVICLFRSSLLSLLMVVLFLQAASFGQVDRAVLEGTVTDPTGAALVRATVKTLDEETGLSQEQKTNANGYYRFPGLAVGRYTLTVVTTGFKTRVIQAVVLQVGQTRTLDVQLAVGATDQSVEVHATDETSQGSLRR